MRHGNRALLLVCAALMGCDARDGTETRTIRLSYMSPDQALELIEPYVGSLENIRRTTSPAALTITAPAARIDQIEELLDRFDVPAPGVQLRFQLIEADGFTQADSSIADVEAALRELFRFRGYRLIAEAFAAGSSRTSTSHALIGPRNTPLQLAVDIGQVMMGRSSQDSAASAAATARGPGNPNDVSATAVQRTVELRVSLLAGGELVLQSAVTVPHGQTVVLGTARPFADMGALILVVRPEIQ